MQNNMVNYVSHSYFPVKSEQDTFQQMLLTEDFFFPLNLKGWKLNSPSWFYTCVYRRARISTSFEFKVILEIHFQSNGKFISVWRMEIWNICASKRNTAVLCHRATRDFCLCFSLFCCILFIDISDQYKIFISVPVIEYEYIMCIQK